VCVLPGVRDALTIGPQTAEFNSFISIEPGLPQPQNAEALADTESPKVKVGEDKAASKDDPNPKEKAKPTKAKAADVASKPKSDASDPKAQEKTQRDPAKA